MLRTTWAYSSSAVVSYLNVAYYLSTTPGELLGSGFNYLDVSNKSARDVFECLAHNLNPATGEKLRPHAREGERVGMDFTFNSTKSVGIARELAGPNNEGDPRIEEAHREAVAYALKFIERDVICRVKGGREPDRQVGNVMAYYVTHRDTRINADDQRPDMSLHGHLFIINTVFDPVEKKWKAAELGQIKKDAPLWESIYHARLASNLRNLGYGIRRKGKSFEIEGISDETIKKFSRRREYIEAETDRRAKKLGIPDSGPRMDGLKAVMGAKTRLGKTKELVEKLNSYYVSRLTDKEKKALQNLKGKPSYECSAEDAARYAMEHCFSRRSVLGHERPEKVGKAAYENGLYTLTETALRYGMGSVDVEAVQAELRRQGLLEKGWEVSNRDVLDQEGRIIDLAREGKGTMRPLSSPDRVNSHGRDTASQLSAEQQALFAHVMSSQDQVILVVADAGTGKTHTSKPIVAAIHAQTGKHVEMLAPSASASRGTLREEGFSKADTAASFLLSHERQAGIKNGVIWIDEASLLAIDDLEKICRIAQAQHARIVLSGDNKQHRAVARDGNMLKVLESYAGLKIGRLTEIHRQKPKAYKEAVALIAKGDILKGHEALERMGAVKHGDGYQGLVRDYLDQRGAGRSVLVVAPTHQAGDQVTAEIRSALKARGKLGADVTVPVLKPLHWTDAQKGDPHAYTGYEVIQWHRNSGACKAGQRVVGSPPLCGNRVEHPEHFTVFSPGEISLAPGDDVRITHNSSSKPDSAGVKHRLDNGSHYTVASVEPAKGGAGHDITLANGWVINTPHLTHGYVSTSYGAQGKTVDVCLAAMGKEAVGAINAAQFYVTASRARHAFRLYTDMDKGELKAAIQRSDTRKSASEVFRPKRRAKNPHIEIRKRAQDFMRRLLREQMQSGMPPQIAKEQERNVGHER